MSSTFAVPAAAPGTPLYLSGPKTMHGTRPWTAAVSRLATLVPAYPIRSAMDLFASRDDWRAHLAEVLRACAALVFLTEADGWLGKGVDTEIVAARTIGLPIAWLTPAGALVPVAAVRFGDPHDEDWTRYRRVYRAAAIPPTGTER